MAQIAVPVRDSVGGALRYVRENWRFVATIAAVFAVASALVSGLTLAVPQIGIVSLVISGILQAFAYGAMTGGALYGAAAISTRWQQDGWRVWASMAVVGFFLCIVVFVVSLPVSIALAAGPLAPYAAELQGAGSNNEAVMTIMMRFVTENPVAIALTMLFYGVIWMLLTSRLYLAAPASVDAGRILTFETWKWTKGAVLGITWARLMLLIPAYILMFALTMLLGRMFGFNVMDGASLEAAAHTNPVGLVIYQFINSFMVMGLYASLEAGLSSYLYKGLRPPETLPAA